MGRRTPRAILNLETEIPQKERAGDYPRLPRSCPFFRCDSLAPLFPLRRLARRLPGCLFLFWFCFLLCVDSRMCVVDLTRRNSSYRWRRQSRDCWTNIDKAFHKFKLVTAPASASGTSHAEVLSGGGAVWLTCSHLVA